MTGGLPRPTPIAMDALCQRLSLAQRPDLDRPGIIAAPDGQVLKIFRMPRHVLSSARFRSYARRFARAASALHKRGIPTVQITGLYRVQPAQRDVVSYRPLPGVSLRDRLHDVSTTPAQRETLLLNLAAFLAHLHGKGVHPRSMHAGNVIVQPDHALGLIDVADCRFARPPLRLGARVRDFRPLLRYPRDREAVHSFGIERFIDHYTHAASLATAQRARLHRAVMEHAAR